ncbi:hypothetical protein ABZP36_000834 [Zizania latifolia]
MTRRESYYRGGNEIDDGVTGFVGILRQLGDLAQLAADVFQGLHDEAMATSQRGHHLALRLKRLDQHLPALHKDYSVCSCSHKKLEHCLFVASNIDRVQWRANVLLKRGVVAGGIIPGFIFESIHRCRGPPQLSLLDKFDPHGEGACLKRYTDPSFFRSHSACSTKLIQQRIQTAKTPPKMLVSFLQEPRPTFQCSDNSRLPKAAQYSGTMYCNTFFLPVFSPHCFPDAQLRAISFRPEICASAQGSLSMFQQLKCRQANGSLRPRTHSFQSEASSEVSIPSTGSPEPNTKAVTKYITVCGGTASVSEERSCELERTSSFEAWLSPNAPILRHDENEITEEEEEAPLRYTCNNGLVVHARANASNMANCKKDSNSYSYKKAVSKRSRYRGGVELIASRVSRLLFGKRQDPLAAADSFRYIPAKVHELKYDAIRDNDSYELEPNANREGDIAPPSPDALFHVLTDHRYVHTTKASSEDVPAALAEAASVSLPGTTEQSDDPYEACYDALLDEVLRQPIAHEEHNGSSVHKPCSTRSITQEHFGPDERHVLSPSMPSSTSVLPGNVCSEGAAKDVVPPPPPIPPMQWLSVKAHSGSTATNHAAGSNCLLPDPVIKQLETEIVQESILASHTEIARPSASDVKYTVDISNRDRICGHEFPEKDSEEIHHQDSFRNCAFQPSEALQTGNGDSDCNGKHKLSTEKLGESYRDLYRMGEVISATHSNEPQVDAQNSLDHHIEEERNSNVHVESVFFSAVQQLTNMNPPSVPRPKYSLLEVGFQDRSTLCFFLVFLSATARDLYTLTTKCLQVRTTPGLIYPSRKLSGQKSILVEEMNDKSYSLKPVPGSGSNVTVDHRNSKVATIMQRADHMRQARADNNDIDTEDSWSDSE